MERMKIAKTHAESLAAIKDPPKSFFSDADMYSLDDSPMRWRCSAGRQRKITETSFWMYDGYSLEHDEWN